MRFFFVLLICFCLTEAENNITDTNGTDSTSPKLSQDKNKTKTTKKSYAKYYQIKRGYKAQEKLFGEWIDIPKGEKRDAYASRVVEQLFNEIEESNDISFIGIVKVKKLKMNAFIHEDTYRTITYVADIVKSYMPKNRKGEIRFDLVLESDETFNPENSSKIFVALVDEGYRYTLDQFMVFPVQWRSIQKIEGLQVDEKIQKLLTKEIKAGYSIENISKETISQTIKIDDDYANLIFAYATKMLDRQNYDFPSRKRFVKKVKRIFDVDISQDIQVNIDSCTVDNNISTKYMPHKVDPERVVFHKKNKFIMLMDRLPFFVNYKKYEELNNTSMAQKDIFSDDKNQTYIVTTWEDIYKQEVPRGRMGVIVKFNKYLFNAEDEHLDWLMRHDPDLMEDLVLKYGYVDDKKLIRKIIKSRQIKDSVSLDGLIYFKSCKRAPINEFESKDDKKNRKRFFVIDYTFKYIQKELGKRKYMDINNNMYLRELKRIYTEMDNVGNLTLGQQEEVKGRIKKLIDKHTEKIVPKYNHSYYKYGLGK